MPRLADSEDWSNGTQIRLGAANATAQQGGEAERVGGESETGASLRNSRRFPASRARPAHFRAAFVWGARACSRKIFKTSRLSCAVRLPRPPVTSYFWLTHLRTFEAS